MGAQADLNESLVKVYAESDSIVIRKNLASIIGGRTLDLTDFSSDDNCIHAGHVVIRSKEDETLYKPMPVSDGAYAALPDGYEYAGVVVATKPVSYPLVGIMYAGEVNDTASPFPVDSIKEALQKALPMLVFMHD